MFKQKTSHLIWTQTTAALAVVAAALGLSGSAPAGESVGFANEIAELGAASKSVIIGFVEKQEIGVSETTAQVRVMQSFSGPLKDGQAFTFRIQSGRVRVQKNQPDLTGVNRAVFFLVEDTAGVYNCIKDNYGFKPIIHDNVYTNPQNPLETVKLKKYKESLTAAFKIAGPKGQN